jgi:phosphoglycolate phosphatase-like HAD superfamily hydrolase
VIAIVSNNSGEAIQRYLTEHKLAEHVALVVGRPQGESSRMKPHPASILAALGSLDVRPDAAALVGDSVTDIEAAKQAGVSSIGFAKTPRRGGELAAARADVIIERMSELANALAEL